MRGIVQGCDSLAVTLDCINHTAVGSTRPEFYRHLTHCQRGAQFLPNIDSAFSVSYCQSSLLAALPLRISWTEVRDMFFCVPLQGPCVSPSDDHFEAHCLWTSSKGS